MPTCAHCNGNKFTCLDGMFFCIECDTQSQDFVDEQASEILAGSSFTTKQLRQTKEKKTVDKGLPWNTAEGFQLIIKAHIKALIDLGISPAIDNTVQQIWFQYVHKTGLAVMDRDLPADCNRDIRFRDFFLENFRDEILPVAKRSQMEVKIRLSKKSRSKSKSDSNLAAAGCLKRDEEWFSVDTALSSDEATDSSKSDCTISSAYKPLHADWNSTGLMTCMKIVCFCHIALQWCKEPVTVGDLIHWIEIGHLPYMGAIECFLPHMKLSSYDHSIFGRLGIPKYDQVVLVSESLTKYLGIPALPNVDVMKIVFRYLVQLNLPLSLMAYLNDLSKKVRISRYQRRSKKCEWTTSKRSMIDCYCPDLIAAGLIGVFLKLLFVLNDNAEWNMDDESTRCCVHEEEGQPPLNTCHLFTWKNWLKYHLLQKEYTMQNVSTVFNMSEPSSVGDVHACMEHYLSLLRKGSTSVKLGDQKRRKEMAETKPLVFRKITEKQGSAEEKRKCKQRRLSRTTLYKLLGYGNKTDYCDFTKCCTHVCVQRMQRRSLTAYVAYNQTACAFQDDNYHTSYCFLLSVLAEITHAGRPSVHDYIRHVESRVVCPDMEKKA